MKKVFSILIVLLSALGLDCMAQTVSGHIGIYDYVDLGLKSGLKWATCNVGASKPADYGTYFAWGEISAKENYTWRTYQWCRDKYNTQTKYCADSVSGKVDSLRVLVANDDAATAGWGGAWRMPTQKEMQELYEGCEWQVTKDFNGSGVAGQIGTSKVNGNVIFFPACGFYDGDKLYDEGQSGGCWSSSLREYASNYAYILYLHDGKINCYGDYRYYGQNVRAVVNE